MTCPNCSSETGDGKRFCADCGASLSAEDARLRAIVQQELSKSLKSDLRDGKLIERELAERVALKVLNWTKIAAAPVALLLALLTIILGLLGYRKYEDFTSSIQRVETVINPKIDRAGRQAEAAQSKASEAQDVVDKALAEARTQLASLMETKTKMDDMAARISTVEKQTRTQIEGSRTTVSAQVSDVQKKLAEALADIGEQRRKLTDTSELVTAMYSKGVVEQFMMLNSSRTQLIAADTTHVSVYMLLKDPPILQTLQLQWHIYVQPKASYRMIGNVVVFRWGQSVENLRTQIMEVSYVPDPSSKEKRFAVLSVKDGNVFADSLRLPSAF